MKRTALAILAILALAAIADTRLPEYAQVAGLSNQIMRIEAGSLATSNAVLAARVAALEASVGDPEGTARVMLRLNAAPDGATDWWEGATASIAVGGNRQIVSIASAQPVVLTGGLGGMASNCTVHVACAVGKPYAVRPIRVKLSPGVSRTVDVTPYSAAGTLQIGRVFKVDSGNPEDFLITVQTQADGSMVTNFGHYADGSWVNETGISNWIGETDAGGALTNTEPDASVKYFERDVWPWNAARTVEVSCNRQPLCFTEVPIYYVKTELTNVVFRTVEDGITTSESVLCRIWWLCKDALDGYRLPAWAYIWEWDSVAGDVAAKTKRAHYYAQYKAVVAGLLSYPYPGTTVGWSRSTAHSNAQALNAYAVYLDGENLGIDPAGGGRTWSGCTWQNWQAFHYLAFIQYGADIRGAFQGITAGGAQARQDVSETARRLNPGLKSFAVNGGATGNNSIVWLGILNPWNSSEGEVMVDVTWFNRHTSALGKHTQLITCNDVAKIQPQGVSYDAMIAAGYHVLSYLTTYSGSTTNPTINNRFRGLDTDWRYEWAWMPCVGTIDAGYRAVNYGANNVCVSYLWTSWAGSAGGADSVTLANLGNYLSNGVGYGPLSVYAYYSGIATSYGTYWGSRPCLNLPAAE